MATSIGIQNDATRDVVTFALWDCAARIADDHLRQKLDDSADESLRLPGERSEERSRERSRTPREAQEAIARLGAIEVSLEAVRAAEIGQSVMLEVSAEEIAKSLGSCLVTIEMEPLYEVPRDERERLLGLHDAVRALAAELQAPAVA